MTVSEADARQLLVSFNSGVCSDYVFAGAESGRKHDGKKETSFWR